MEGCKFEITRKKHVKTPHFQLLKVKEDIYIIGKYAVETGDFQLLIVRRIYTNFKQCTKCKEYLPATM